MKNITSLFLVAGLVSVLMSCNDSTEEPKPKKEPKTETTNPADQAGTEIEAYIASIDENKELPMGNSLDYSTTDGRSFLVEFVVNDSSEIVKMTQMYTLSESGSIESKVFYYKAGSMCASKEFFERGTGDAANFVERVTYYDENAKAVVSKERVAPFEDMLVQETFKIAETTDVSDKKAIRALNQEEEFETNFRGFASEGPLKYLIVGENKDGGYLSTLLVQYRTPFVESMIADENVYMGTKLEVNFERVDETTGFTFQALMGVRRAPVEKKVVEKVKKAS